jgi:hypothetical protein
MSPFLYNAFEPNDRRFSEWVGVDSSTGTSYFFPYKYKQAITGNPVTEYTMVFRLAEQVLIRAEAEAELNDLADAALDLNAIRNRAGLPNTTAANQAQLLAAILQERKIELFTEWGHRWLDLKRTGNIDQVMGSGGVTAAKGGSWNSDWALFPIPLAELQRDPNLSQNSGY